MSPLAELAPPPARSRRPLAGGRAARSLLRALAAAGRVLPLPFLRATTRRVADLLWRASPALRASLDRNARRLIGAETGEEERERLCRAQLRSFADFTAEVAACGKGIGPGELLERVEGADHLERALAARRGVIAVSLHLGNYELAAAALAPRVAGGVAIVYNRDPARAWEERRAKWRRRMGIDEIAIDRSPFFGIEAFARLRRGGGVLLAGDQVESRDGDVVPFLRGTAAFSPWPARLALTSGAPLLPAFAARQPGGRYVLHLESPVFPGKREPRALTEELALVYERYLRLFPEQWLMLRPFWLEDVEQV